MVKYILILLFFLIFQKVSAQEDRIEIRSELIKEYLDFLDKENYDWMDTIVVCNKYNNEYKKIMVKQIDCNDYKMSYLMNTDLHYLIPILDLYFKDNTTLRVTLRLAETYGIENTNNLNGVEQIINHLPKDEDFFLEKTLYFDCETNKWKEL